MRRIAIAGLLVLLIAIATPAVSAGPDLIVDRIDPKYIFVDLENSLFVNVSNIGDTASGTYNVSIQITNDAGTVRYSYKASDCASLAAGESTLDTRGLDVSLGSWTPSTLENITLTVTADCDGDVTEDDENNNASTEYRNTTGDCVSDTMLPASCYGYAGDHPMAEVYSGKGKVIYTIGDHVKSTQIANFTIGASGDTNQVDGGIANIPDNAQVTSAKLYVHYGWKSNAGSFDDDPTDDFEMSIDGGSRLTPESIYTDCKNFSTVYTYYQYGAIVYDVTADVTGDGTYQVVRTNYSSGKGSTYSMSLMITYDDCSNDTYSIAHGYDRLAAVYWYSYSARTNRWEYYVSPDDATTTSTHPDVDPDDILEARWFTVAIDTADDTTDGEYQKINDCPWGAGAWLKDSGSYLAFNRTTACITAAGTTETVSYREGLKQSSNGIGSILTCLMTSSERDGAECLGSCYDNDTCSADLIGDDMNCSACTNGTGYYWKPNKDSDCYADKTPWDMCIDWCPQCCDAVDNDADGDTDFPADDQCSCGLDPDETTSSCPVPELATFTLVGIGLMMFAGVIYRRKE